MTSLFDSRTLEGLTDAQRRCVDHPLSPPLAVLAGPGTGKTRVLTLRIARLIEQGVEPSTVVALTFTNKAADEMRRRLAELVGGGAADTVFAGTFHRFGSMLLRRFGDLAGLPARPDLTDAALEKRLMRGLVGDAIEAGDIPTGTSSVDDLAKSFLRWVGVLGNEGILPSEAPGVAERWRSHAAGIDDEARREAELVRVERFEQAVLLYARYDALLRERRLASYDDLIGLPTRLLESCAPARSLVRDDYRVFLVDEFQDVNHAQIRLLRALVPPTGEGSREGVGASITVVGDDDQAIYGFRGATDMAFQTFSTDYPDAATITLGDNFRSSGAVVASANALIAKAHARAASDKTLAARRSDLPEPAPALAEGVTLEKNAQIPSTLIAMVRADRARSPDGSYSGTAVICRSNDEIVEIASALEVAGVPTRVTRESRQSDEPAVIDLLHWCKLATDPTATWAASRTMVRPPIGLDAALVGGWLRAYRASVAKSRTLLSEGPPALVDALETEVLPTLSGGEALKLSRWVEVVRRVSDGAHRLSAGEALREILSATGLAVADLPSPRVYARRVHVLSAIVTFAQTRARFFDPPGDLRAFLSYYEDLDGEDAELPTIETDADDDGPDDGEAGDGRVQVLTAHKAKGLEFDTVYVPRIGPRAGFGRKANVKEESLPAFLGPGVADGRSSVERLEDEQRRLFYVAITRAERRLVLLAESVKSQSRANFYQNLEGDRVLAARARSEVLEDAADVLGGDPTAPDTSALALADDARRALDSIAAEARLSAARALSAVEHGADPGEAEARLGRALREIAVVRAARSGGDVEAVAASLGARQIAAEVSSRLADLPALASIDPASPEILAPHTPDQGPITLDYSKITLFLQCPLCYYVKHVARLAEPPSSAATIGSLAHAALEGFYRRVLDAEADGRPSPGLETLLALADEVFAGEVDHTPELRRADLGRLRAILTRGYDLHNPSIHTLHVEQSYTSAYECDGVKHRLTGRIDRLDQSPDGSPVIIDYKTGGSRSREKPAKDDLQLVLYRLLLEGQEGWSELVEAGRGAAEYWVLAHGSRGRLSFEEMKVQKVRTQIDSVIRGLTDGRLTRNPGTCRGLCSIVCNARAQAG